MNKFSQSIYRNAWLAMQAVTTESIAGLYSVQKQRVCTGKVFFLSHGVQYSER